MTFLNPTKKKKNNISFFFYSDQYFYAIGKPTYGNINVISLQYK